MLLYPSVFAGELLTVLGWVDSLGGTFCSSRVVTQKFGGTETERVASSKA